jgi:hypothetical protein
MTWAAVAGAGASLVGSSVSANQAAASQGAANEYNVNIEEARMRQAQDTGRYVSEKYAYEQAAANELAAFKEEQLAPYTGAGRESTQQMQALLGLSGAEAGEAARAKFTESPGQAFLREQQEKAVLRNLSATGGLRGGRAKTALQEQAFGRAQTDFGNYYARLAGLSGQGLEASKQIRGQTTTPAPVYDPAAATIERPEEKAKRRFGATGFIDEMFGRSAGENYQRIDPFSGSVDYVAGSVLGGGK